MLYAVKFLFLSAYTWGKWKSANQFIIKVISIINHQKVLSSSSSQPAVHNRDFTPFQWFLSVRLLVSWKLWDKTKSREIRMSPVLNHHASFSLNTFYKQYRLNPFFSIVTGPSTESSLFTISCPNFALH